MSHELRTPLNSLLILAQQLTDNPHQHLDPREVEYARTIHSAGDDLLALINEILDLSKIESGTVSLDLAPVAFAALRDQLDRTFRHVAQSRGLGFAVTLAPDLPPTLDTDDQRLLQVMKNLLSNAFKFTERGQVTVQVAHATAGWSADRDLLNHARAVFAFTVADTGIGIPPDRQRIVFEAFQQADGSTARKYGGTGLGLSISREIALLLGGELRLVRSAADEGSVFVLYVPQHSGGSHAAPQWERSVAAMSRSPETTPDRGRTALSQVEVASSAVQALRDAEVADDLATLQPGDAVLLIVEDDPAFARIILELAREQGFKGIVAMRGAQAMDLARRYKPDAITLDIRIPDMYGWTILDLLKHDPELRHIPVDVITVEEDAQRGLQLGAFQFLTKPVDREHLDAALVAIRKLLNQKVKNLLLVVADPAQQQAIAELLGNGAGDVIIQQAANGKAGLAAMRKKTFDCVVVGAMLPDMSGPEFIAAVRKNKALAGVPAVIYSSEPLSEAERAALERLAGTGPVKAVGTPGRLLDQTALFLHRVLATLPAEKRQLLEEGGSAVALAGKTVLIVDDDVRNIFALTAALERHGMNVLSAESGRAGIDLLKARPEIAICLMDIMMPGMDGYEAMREIRTLEPFRSLPIIALTAKAMPGDRDRCIEAGASVYLSKPVNVENLTALMRVWLAR